MARLAAFLCQTRNQPVRFLTKTRKRRHGSARCRRNTAPPAAAAPRRRITPRRKRRGRAETAVVAVCAAVERRHAPRPSGCCRGAPSAGVAAGVPGDRQGFRDRLPDEANRKAAANRGRAISFAAEINYGPRWSDLTHIHLSRETPPAKGTWRGTCLANSPLGVGRV